MNFSASRGDTKSPDEILKSAHSPETTTVASIEPNEFFKHTFGRGKKLQQQQLPQAEDDEIDEHRQELIDRYHSLLREKRELRKRNAQAQTNICQYLRKHSIDLFPPIADRSQVNIYSLYYLLYIYYKPFPCLFPRPALLLVLMKKQYQILLYDTV